MEKGIMAALITPLDVDERIDTLSLKSLLEWVIAAGVMGIFVGGTVGEGAALRDSEKFILYKETVKFVNGRVPVLANVSDVGTIRSLELLKLATEADVDIIVSTARCVFPSRTPGETFRHISAIAAASVLPVWFYENPSTTGISNTFESLEKIMGIENIKGLKFSAQDKELFTKCVKEFGHRMPVMTGNVADIAYAASIGAGGAISGIGSLAPKLCVRCFEEASAGHVEAAEKISESIQSLYAIYGGDGWPLWPSAQKQALKRLGVIRTSVVTSPFIQIDSDSEATIDRALAGCGVSPE